MTAAKLKVSLTISAGFFVCNFFPRIPLDKYQILVYTMCNRLRKMNKRLLSRCNVG